MRNILLITLLLIVQNIYSQSETYFYSNGRKVYLQENTNQVVFKGKTGFVRLELESSNRRSKMDSLKNHKVEVYRVYKSEFGDNYATTNSLIFKLKENGKKDVYDLLKRNGVDPNSIVQKKYNRFKVNLVNDQKLFSLSNALYESGLVEYCHPNFIVEIEKTTNDPLYVFQYYLENTSNPGNDINYEAALDYIDGLTLHPIRIAVIDDGVEPHSDIATVLDGFTPRSATGLGRPRFAGQGHGQACAGIIAAEHDNQFLTGISPNAEILPINIFFGGETNEDYADAIDFAWDEGEADVISNSWGFPESTTIIDDIEAAINRARGDGSVVVWASGNSHPYLNGVTFPANVPGVLTVGAMKSNGSIWGYSSRGPQMDVVAPSGDTGGNGDVYTLDREGINGYSNNDFTTNFGGTSAACPQVAGVVGMMLSVNPNLTESEVRTIIRNTAIDKGSSGFDNTFGYGLIDAYAAVSNACNGDTKLINTTVYGTKVINSKCDVLIENSEVWTNGTLNINLMSPNTILKVDGPFEALPGSTLDWE